jgi:hypothetical protein
VEYERDERLAGESKYPLKKMIKLSLDGLTSFSYQPIKLATYAGSIIISSGLLYLLVLLFMKIFSKFVISGWNLVLAIQFVLSGFLLTMMGVIGEYIGRIYDETRDRPLYIVSECCGLNEEQIVKEERVVKTERNVKKVV